MQILKEILQSKSLQTKSIFLFFGRVSGFIMNFLIPIILVRYITKIEFGYFQQFNLIYSSGVIIFSMWINSSIYYFFPKSNKEEKSLYVFLIFLIEILLWVFLLILFCLFRSEFLDYFNLQNINTDFSFVIIFTLLLLFFSSILDFLFVVEDKKLHNLIYFPIDRLLKGVLIVVFTIYFSIDGIILAFFIYSIAKFLYTIVYCWKFIDDLNINNYSVSIEKLFSMLKYSLPFGIGLIAQNIGLRLDQFLLIDHVSTSDFAIYSLAFYGIPIVNFILSSINNVAMPELTSFAKSGDFDSIIILWNKIIVKTISVTIPALGFFVVFAPEIIVFLFTESYLDSILYYRIYLFTVLFSATSYGLVLRASNQTKYVMISNIIGLVFSLVSAFILIPQFKMHGAIVTAMISFIVPVLLQIFFELRYLKVGLTKIIPFQKIIINILLTGFALCFAVIFRFFLEDTLLILLFSFVFFSLSVVIVQYRLNCFILQKELSKIISKLNIQ